jgi:hypothetical protein
MARELVNVPNVDAPTADYPNGRVRDKVGATIGTTYTEALHGDIIQLFQKMLIDAGVTENNLPDNVTNGYQLLEALNAKIADTTKASSTITNIINGTTLSSGTIAIPASTEDRMIYAYSGGTVSATFSAFLNLDGNVVGRFKEVDSASMLLPKGVSGDLTWVAGNADMTVEGQIIGI